LKKAENEDDSSPRSGSIFESGVDEEEESVGGLI
jgi:hypothetical protein